MALLVGIVEHAVIVAVQKSCSRWQVPKRIDSDMLLLSVDYCRSMASFHVWPHCTNAWRNRCQEDHNRCPLENWRRSPGRPYTTWMKTIQQDLKFNNLSVDEAITVAQNHPLWRLMSAFSATRPQWCLPRKKKLLRARPLWQNQLRCANRQEEKVVDQWESVDEMLSYVVVDCVGDGVSQYEACGSTHNVDLLTCCWGWVDDLVVLVSYSFH